MDDDYDMGAVTASNDQATFQLVVQPNDIQNDMNPNAENLHNESLHSHHTEQVVDTQENEMKLEYFVDFNLFRKIDCDDHCDGKHGYCKANERVIAALDYHQFLVNGGLDAKYCGDPLTAFTAFCEELYPKTAILNDYIHFVTHHADAQGLEYIRGRLQFSCNSAAKCGSTNRHYRDRRMENEHDMTTSWFIDLIDSIHFMVHHIYEVGLRVEVQLLAKELSSHFDEGRNDWHLIDFTLKRMIEEIKTKKAVVRTGRLDANQNTKFTLDVNDDDAKQGAFC